MLIARRLMIGLLAMLLGLLPCAMPIAAGPLAEATSHAAAAETGHDHHAAHSYGHGPAIAGDLENAPASSHGAGHGHPAGVCAAAGCALLPAGSIELRHKLADRLPALKPGPSLERPATLAFVIFKPPRLGLSFQRSA